MGGYTYTPDEWSQREDIRLMPNQLNWKKIKGNFINN